MKSKLKSQVENILKTLPHTRNSDITLSIEVWKEYYGRYIQSGIVGDSIQLASLYELPREDNIKRIRAMFNSKGLYWPTDLKIAKARGIKEDQWREALGYPSVAATQTPTREESYTQQPAPAISSRPDDGQMGLF